jgi:Coenzyme PQQ synthesis protein D (PqqD)
VLTCDQPSDSVRTIEVDGGLLLLDTSSHRLWAYNGTARKVWDLLERGLSPSAIAAELVDCFGIARETAGHDVQAILLQWGSQGLLVPSGGQRAASGGAIAAPVTRNWAHMPESAWAGGLTFTVRDRVFSIAAEDPRWLTYVHVMLAHLETRHAQPQIRLEVREDGKDSVLLVNGHERVRTDDAGNLIGALNQSILEQIHPEINWLAMIHGGAMARDGAGFAVPAACGSGKATLIAYLNAQKGYTYIADDMIALAAPDGRIVPWPMPLSLKEGSWQLLSEWYPHLASFPQYRSTRGEARQIMPPAGAWNAKPVPLHAFIFPSYVAGAAATLTRLTASQAFERLLSDRIWLGYPITEQRVRSFLAWLEHKPAYLLVHGNVGEGARLLEDVT